LDFQRGSFCHRSLFSHIVNNNAWDGELLLHVAVEDERQPSLARSQKASKCKLSVIAASSAGGG
jgi:hypothetical protein